MSEPQHAAPESTAARVALWRALHVRSDAPPHVLEDEVGLKLLAPDPGWQQRGDMDPQFTRPFRASIAGRPDGLCPPRAYRALTAHEQAPATP